MHVRRTILCLASIFLWAAHDPDVASGQLAEAAASEGPSLELVAEPEQKHCLLIGVGYVPRFRAQH